MFIEHTPHWILLAGLCSMAATGCGSAGDTEDGDGSIGGVGEQTAGAGQGSGGEAAGTSGDADGGETATSGAPSGGDSGQGGSAGASGGASAAGGQGASGGSGESGAGDGGGGASGEAGSGVAGQAAGGAGENSGGAAGAAMSGDEAGAAGDGTAGDDDSASDDDDEPFTGTCTESSPAGSNASGSGPHDVVIEVNDDPGINEGTIFRPADLGGNEKYPIFVWGQGGCSQNGLSNETAMAEIASHGYFVIADGTPGGGGNRPMDRSDLDAMGAPLMAYVDWAIAENDKPCSAYYQSLEPTKISSNGFSCGGLMAQGTVVDDRIVTWGVTSSGMAGATQEFYDLIDTPVLFVEGGPAEVAYDGGLEGYQKIAELGVPVLWFSADLGHGGDLFQADGGDFTKINLAWLNWWLKDDESATGKGLLVGADCPYCSDNAWEVMSANVP